MSLELTKVISNLKEEDMTKAQELIENIQQRLGALDAGEIEHFYVLSKVLLDCYASNSMRASVILSNEKEDFLTLIAVNADELQIQEMVSEMGELFASQVTHGKQIPMQLN